MSESSSYYLLLLRYLDFKILLTSAQIIAYNKISPIGTGADFSKIESRDVPQSINPKLASTFVFESYLFLELY